MTKELKNNMKKILFVMILFVLCENVSAQWKTALLGHPLSKKELKEAVKKARQGDEEAYNKVLKNYVITGEYDKSDSLTLSLAKEGYAFAQEQMADLLKDKDKSQSLYWKKKAAEQGRPTPLISVAQFYQWNEDSVNTKKAFQLYKKGFEQNVISPGDLALCYLYGLGVEQNVDEAYRLFQLAPKNHAIYYSIEKGLCCLAKQEYQQAFECFEGYDLDGRNYYLGLCYEYGFGVNKDWAKAFEYYQKMANEKYTLHKLEQRLAYEKLSIFYRDGKGVKQNKELSGYYTEKAFPKNSLIGRNSHLKMAGNLLRRGSKQDVDMAMQYLRASIMRGDLHESLSFIYHNMLILPGKLYDTFSLKHLLMLEECYSKYYSYNDDNNYFITLLYEYIGEYYLRGFGVDADNVQAEHWYAKVAERGRSIHNLPIVRYKIGLDYHEKGDFDGAFPWLKAAAEDVNNPIPDAMRLLAGCYLYGSENIKNPEEAKRWREKAMSTNNPKALELELLIYD